MTQSTVPPDRAVRPRRSRSRRLLLGGVILAVGFIGFLLLVPTILSMDWARAWVERSMSEELGTEVRIADYGFGWFSGLEVDGVAIENPPGFESEEELFELRSLRGDLGVAALLRGRVSLEGVADGLALRVRQRADGTTNLGEVLGMSPGVRTEPGEPPQRDPEPAMDLSDLRLDLELRDAFIEVVHEEQGVLERLQNVHARISKDYGTSVAKLTFAADLHRPGTDQTGRIEIQLDAAPRADAPVDMHLNCIGVDLSRYRPILAAFVSADRITAFEGVVAANARLTGVPAELLTLEGTVEVERPHIAGEFVSGLDLQAERWTLRPNATAKLPGEGRAPEIDLSELEADLGFLRVNGLPTAAVGGAPRSTGFAFDLDVARLADAGGPVPAMLKGSGTTVKGELRLPLVEDLTEFDPAALLTQVVLDAALAVQSLQVANQSIEGLAADVDLAGGKLVLAATSGRFNGGALTLRVEADATQLPQPPVSVAVGLENAAVGASAVGALQYVVPLLAGLSPATAAGAPVQFDSRGDLELTLSGPAYPREGQPILAWLDEVTGTGRLALAEGSFRPAPALAGLLQLTGDQGSLDFEGLATSFRVHEGFVETGLLQLSAAGREFGIEGRTSLSGEIEYSIDVRSMLAAHSDGQKILELLGDTPIAAKLGGTLDDPRLLMPDIESIAQEALRAAIETRGRDLIEKEAGDLIEKILGKDRQPGTQPQQPGTPEDQAKQVLEGVLRGIIGPPPKPATGQKEKQRDGGR